MKQKKYVKLKKKLGKWLDDNNDNIIDILEYINKNYKKGKKKEIKKEAVESTEFKDCFNTNDFINELDIPKKTKKALKKMWRKTPTKYMLPIMKNTKISKMDECWARSAKSNKRRHFYIAFVGNIPKGHFVYQKKSCNIDNCHNPTHMFTMHPKDKDNPYNK